MAHGSASPESSRHPSSFRDPAGHIFFEDGVLKRLITRHGLSDYNRFITTGLADHLTRQRLIIKILGEYDTPDGCKIITPQTIPFISYPYEWSFSQLKDAALLTLQIARSALDYQMVLKDASAFNIQFIGCRPIFIDTLSFERNSPGGWRAYGQFCRHFIAPLMLLSKVSYFFQPFWKHSIDGCPLDVAAALLPGTSYLRPGSLIHIHLHAWSIRKRSRSTGPARLTKRQAVDRKPALLDSLRSTVEGLPPPPSTSEWKHYYDQAYHYSSSADSSKQRIVETVLDSVRPSTMIDLGSNTGRYARLASRRGIRCVALDIDPHCADLSYLHGKRDQDELLLPLVTDLANPAGGLGFAGHERSPLAPRIRSDFALALALIHHLRITGGIPLAEISAYLASLCRHLLIEFVPKHDPMAGLLLANREDTFHDYSYDSFIETFGRDFYLQRHFSLPDCSRKLCLFTTSTVSSSKSSKTRSI